MGARAELGGARSGARTCEFGGIAGASECVLARRGAAPISPSQHERPSGILSSRGDVAQPNLNNNVALEKGESTLRSFPTMSEPSF